MNIYKEGITFLKSFISYQIRFESTFQSAFMKITSIFPSITWVQLKDVILQSKMVCEGSINIFIVLEGILLGKIS